MADNIKTTKSTKKSVSKNKSLKNSKVISPAKKKKMDMNSDELLESILNKKRKKVEKIELPKLKTNNKHTVDNKNKEELSSEELLEKILQKKKNKSNKVKSSSNKTHNYTKDIELPKIKESKELTEIPKLEFPKKDDTIITRSISIDEIKQLSEENEKTLLESELDIRDIREALELSKKKPNKKYLSKPSKIKKNSKVKVSPINKFKTIDRADAKDNIVDVESTKKVEQNDLNNNVLPQENNVKINDKDIINNKDEVKKINYSLEFNKTVFVYVILIILLVCIIYLSIALFNSFKSNDDPKYLKNNNTNSLLEVEILQKRSLYEECLTLPYNESDNTDAIMKKIEEVNAYLDMYKVSVGYEDLEHGFIYNYKPNTTYYAASTIKALDALYIYSKAYDGVINLDDTITYSKKYKVGASAYVGSFKVGSKLSLRELVKAAVTVSDNSAHHMLVDYIGYNNLKEYGRSLGATATLSGNDNFGYINVNDGLIYMKKLNEFFENGGELGKELKSYFVNSDENSLKTDTIEAATKYGEYAPVFHNIGVVYHEHPYVISILTNEKNGDFELKVRNINLKVMELHNLYYSNRSDVCLSSVYGN